VNRWPVYIVSKGRSDTILTAPLLDQLGVTYRIIVEAQEQAAYEARFPGRTLTLPTSYQDDYDTYDDIGDAKSRGPGPARNYAWQHSIDLGADWHWVMDDNLQFFDRFHQNRKVRFGDGSVLWLMEEFAMQWRNVAMAGPNYHMFVIPRTKRPPFQVGTRIYSCNLIRNHLPIWPRWRGRYNEDTDLSLRMLKAGYQTVLFNAYLVFKTRTQAMKGGNTDEFYAHEGTYPKSRMLALMHPDVARVKTKFNRDHHEVDYSQWRHRPLLPDPDYQPSPVPTLTASPRSSRYTETHATSERWGW